MSSSRVMYWMGVVFILACVVGAAHFFLHIRSGPPHDWVTQTFAGTVVRVSTSTIAVVDARDNERLFMLAPHTIVRKGVSTVSRSVLATGQVVLIHAPPVPGTPNEAREIRILSTDTLDGVKLKPY